MNLNIKGYIRYPLLDFRFLIFKGGVLNEGQFFPNQIQNAENLWKND